MTVHRLRSLRLLLAALALWLLVPAAQAVIVTGSFRGLAVNVTGHGHLPGGGEGSPLSGTFSFDRDGVQIDDIYTSAMEFSLTLDLLGRHLVYGPGGVSIFMVENGPQGQEVTLNTYTAYWSAGLWLTTPEHFVDGHELASFQAAPVDAARSTLWFTPGRWSGWSADAVLTEVTIDPIAAPIPEPPVWAGLMLGVAVLASRLRRRARTSGSKRPS